MVLQLVCWAPAIPFIRVGDEAIACAKLALTYFKYNIALISRLKMNARIYALPEENPAGKRGRKPKKGQHLILKKLWQIHQHKPSNYYLNQTGADSAITF